MCHKPKYTAKYSENSGVKRRKSRWSCVDDNILDQMPMSQYTAIQMKNVKYSTLKFIILEQNKNHKAII